jgi:hypothetical protein
MENVGIFYDQLEYRTAIWCMLWPFGTLCGLKTLNPMHRNTGVVYANSEVVGLDAG